MMRWNCWTVHIQYHIFKIILSTTQKHETFSTNSSIQNTQSGLRKRLVLKTEDGYKLEIKIPETMKLFGSTKILLDKQRMEKIYPVVKYSK